MAQEKTDYPMLCVADEFEVKVDNKKDDSILGFGKRKLLIVAGVLLVVLVVIVIIVLAVVLTKKDKEASIGDEGVFPVILISMDGFRSDYMTEENAPNILKLAKNGVRAKYLLPQFPTKTFPNHYSIATGLFPVHHGVVANSFKDASLNDNFRIGGPTFLDPKWWGGEPMWITATKQGLTCATYFWVGSEVEIKGIRPKYFYLYNQSHPFEPRIDKVLSWLDLPKKDRPSFITLYFHEPDRAGHIYGSNSAQAAKSTKFVDSMIGRLYEGLKDRSLDEKVNVVLVSDHGMANVSCNRVVFLDKYNVTLNDVDTSVPGGTFLTMNPKPGANSLDILSKLQCKDPHLRVSLKEKLPKRLHYSKNRRIGEIVVIPEVGWLVGTNSTAGYNTKYCTGGNHGYDNIDRPMRTIFVAHGPSFKKGEVVEPFVNTEIYDLLAVLLKVKPAKNDGTPGSLAHILNPDVDVTVPKPKSDGRIMRSDICRYPTDPAVLAVRQCSSCVCPYCKPNKTEAKRYDQLLNLSDAEIFDSQVTQFPWGLPKGGAGREGCILTHKEFVIGYSTYLRIPLWVGHRMDGEKASQSLPRKNCFRQDVRLSRAQSSNCSNYFRSGFDRGHLVANADLDYHYNAVLNTYMLSNIAPQYPSFNRKIWLALERLVRSWSSKFTTVYVISGSIFDEDADGLRDDDTDQKSWLHNQTGSVAIPTHYYKVITRCLADLKPYHVVRDCKGRLDVISFVLPNTGAEYCQFQSSDEYLLEHVARVRDIELLTGVNFFGDLPAAEQARIKTILPTQLWN